MWLLDLAIQLPTKLLLGLGKRRLPLQRSTLRPEPVLRQRKWMHVPLPELDLPKQLCFQQ